MGGVKAKISRFKVIKAAFTASLTAISKADFFIIVRIIAAG